ncbi:MAG TPA: carboxypeptidase regulatory-like domain-containing protein [Vicinamibacterales bacterium]|nr:carboxypeptidase regulatory-like domain-containing protein [Vicinamibacterales bacterium]
MTRVFRGILLAAGILVSTAGLANAQAIGSIFGKVTDPSGGVLPGVTVTVTGPALQRPLVATTSASGTYQFPSVPIGTFTVTFELSGFKKAARSNVVITTNFNAPIDQKMEIGQVSEEMTVTAAAPVVDTKKTTTGATFTKDILENIPTARDPWQIIGMTPGVQAGLNVGGSASGQQVGLSVYGTSANVQWNLEGGSITDLSSNSSPSYFNFDSFEQIQVTTGGGDVSVQSSGLSINLVSKSGSNVFKGTAVATFENDAMQTNNVTPELFYAGSNGLLSGNPVQKIAVYSVEYGGPIMRNRLWWWAAADKQDINAGVVNFFDPNKGSYCQQLITAQKQGQLGSAVTYDKLQDVQNCLSNDKTVIKDLEWKFNYQLNSANKIQWLFTSDNKYRNRRGASANTAQEAVTQQTSDMPWGFPLPTHSLTHTLILTDKLVFNNQFTYVGGGFFLDYQDVPPQGSCSQSRYTGSADINSYAKDPSCLWNVQPLSNNTTGFASRSLGGTYQTVRKSWEAKTDGTYFLTNKVGGDHSLKFGVGWRKNPILTFSHYSAGARAQVNCVGNNRNNCGTGTFLGNTAPAGSQGFVPRNALLSRDQLRNNNWWTYNGYIQDGYSRGRLRLQGGLRYDWQTSTYLGGCVPANALRPDLLPSQCEGFTDQSTVLDPNTGLPIKDSNGNNVHETLPAFSVWAPRVSATYDLFGNGKTSVHASYSLYYQTKITLADSLGGLFTQTALTWGNNQTSGACSTAAGASCWTDANKDGLVQVGELIGTPSTSSSRFDLNTGILTPAGNAVSKDAKLSRTREFITGIQHELIPNLAVGVDYVYRNYDQGTAAYTAGYQPGSSQFPLSQIYTGPLYYTDPVTGTQAPYYQICNGCVRPSGIGAITITSLGYSTYQAIIPTLNKRFSNRWQMNASATFQTNPSFQPLGSYTNPTGVQFTDSRSTIARYLVRVSGTYALAYGITASGNLTVNDGANRTLSVNGPGDVYGGLTPSGAAAGAVTYNTLTFQPAGTTRFSPTKLLDLGAQKVFTFRGGKNRLKLMFDAFNVFNINTIQSYSSNNLSSSNFNAPTSIVPPRVFRVGAQIVF